MSCCAPLTELLSSRSVVGRNWVPLSGQAGSPRLRTETLAPPWGCKGHHLELFIGERLSEEEEDCLAMRKGFPPRRVCGSSFRGTREEDGINLMVSRRADDMPRTVILFAESSSPLVLPRLNCLPGQRSGTAWLRSTPFPSPAEGTNAGAR